MAEKKEDIRVIKSKKALKKALLKLLENESFEKINVSDICEEAKINRMTFYNHYKDKYTLFNDAIKDISEQITHELKRDIVVYNIKKTEDILLQLFKIICQISYEHKKVLQGISFNQNVSYLYEIAVSIEDGPFKQFIEPIYSENGRYKEVSRHILLGASASLVSYYVNNYPNLDTTEFFEYIRIYLNKKIS